MPSIQRARKAAARAKKVRREAWRRARNRSGRSGARTLVAKARAAIAGDGSEDVAAVLGQALVKLDAAASKGIIHKRNAARRKSRLMRLYQTKLATAAKPVRRRSAKKNP